jgi:hypothetical protein
MTLTENLIDGSGSNTYNFTFPILDQQDVKVQLREFDPNLPPEEKLSHKYPLLHLTYSLVLIGLFSNQFLKRLFIKMLMVM